MYDLIVIGKGPAGLSAALYLGRAGYKVLVLGKESNLEKCDELDNYLGINKISGIEFIDIAEKQVINIGVKIKKEKVLKLSEVDNKFNVITDVGEYTSKTIILALGAKKGSVKIDNIDKFTGKGVSYCVACDGFFYKNKKVGVIGNSEYAFQEALDLKSYTDDITIFTDGKDISDISKKYISNIEYFKFDNRVIKSVDGDNMIKYIIFEDEAKVEIDGIFIANDTPNIDDLSNSIGIIVKDDKIVIDESNMTNIEGIFVCGDMINNFKQVSTAVGSGAVAGYGCTKYLLNLKLNKEEKNER
jgi:thioredoxin reductase (NADPH)